MCLMKIIVFTSGPAIPTIYLMCGAFCLVCDDHEYEYQTVYHVCCHHLQAPLLQCPQTGDNTKKEKRIKCLWLSYLS